MSVQAISGSAFVSGYGIATSGMQAAQAEFDVAANNIANNETPGYESQGVSLEPLPGGGVETSGVGVLPGVPPADPQESNVDMGQQMAGMMVASGTYSANAKVVDVATQMERALLDIKV